jgi:AcrR family transcriptional regulator
MTSRSPLAFPVESHFDLGAPVELTCETLRAPRCDVRLKLLDAALEILLCQGIQAFTQARVAERAGVRQSHLTYYFPTRSQLLTAVVERGSQVVIDTMGGASSASLPPTLADFRQAMAERVSDTRMPRLMVALSVASDEDPSLKVWMAEFDMRMLERMRMAFIHYGVAIEATDLALFYATLVGIATLNVNVSTPESARQASRLSIIAFDRLVRDNALSPVRTEKDQEKTKKPKGLSGQKTKITNE